MDKQGHWATKSRNGAYAHNAIPWEAVRVLSGFSPDRGTFYLERALLEPPPELKKKFFRYLSNKKKFLKSHTIQMILQVNNDVSYRIGKYFFEMIEYFRTVILQDAAVLTEIEGYQNHSLFKHEIFKSKEFLDYKTELNNCMKNNVAPESLILSKCMPIIAQKLNDVNTNTITLR